MASSSVSLVGVVEEMSCGATRTPETWRELLQAVPEPSENELAQLLAFVARTHNAVDEGRSAKTITAALGGLSLVDDDT